MGSRCDGIQTGEVVGTSGGKDGNSVRGLRKPVRLLPFELSRRGNPPNLPFSMSGSLSPRERGDVSAGGLRKPAVFTPTPIQTGILIQTHRSLAEIQAFLVTLVREFDFSIPEGRNIRTARPGMLVPIVIGEEDKGPQLPLKITPVRDI